MLLGARAGQQPFIRLNRASRNRWVTHTVTLNIPYEPEIIPQK